MARVFRLIIGLAGARALMLGLNAPPAVQLCLWARQRPPLVRSVHALMTSELPITSSSSLAEMRALIAERGLDIKTTGKGRNKKVVFKELVALCSSADGCEASEMQPTTGTGKAPVAEVEEVEPYKCVVELPRVGFHPGAGRSGP